MPCEVGGEMSNLTKEEFAYYLNKNCEIETAPICSECESNYNDVYTDHLDGNMFCEECLFKSLSKDSYTLKELRQEMQIK